MRLFLTSSIIIPALLFLNIPFGTAQNTRPQAMDLLPATTTAYVSVPDVERLRDSWNETQLGILMQDKQMAPFVKDFQKGLANNLGQAKARLGITLQDLEGVPTGEVSLSVIQVKPAKPPKNGKKEFLGEASLVLIVDVEGNTESAKNLLDNVDKQLRLRGGKKIPIILKINGNNVEVTSYRGIPRVQQNNARQMFFTIHKEMLLATDNKAVMANILKRFVAKPANNLKSQPAFANVMQRVSKDGQQPPHIRWYIKPFEFIESMRAINAPPGRQRDPHLMHWGLKEAGFDIISGIGGVIQFMDNGYEALHRTAIYAPKDPKAKNGKFRLGAAMLEFPSASAAGFDPPAWVPHDLASYTSFYIDINNAFESIKYIVDGLAKDEIFEDGIEGMKNDGGIDVRKDVIGNLGNRVIVISDYKLEKGKVTTESERILVAIATKNNIKALRDVLKKWDADDDTVYRRKHNGHIIYESVQEPEEDLDLGIGGDVPKIGNPAPAPPPQPKFTMPNSAVTLIDGYLLRATHIDFLIKILDRIKKAKADRTLAKAADYKEVAQAMENLGAKETSFRFFSRTDEEYRVTYELIKMGKLPQSKTLMGRLLSRFLDDPAQKKPRQQKLKGKNLPNFAFVSQHLGPAGMFITTTQDGWDIVGFNLRKREEVAVKQESPQMK